MGGERHALFKVLAGGQNLTYKWYEVIDNNAAVLVTDDNTHYEGSTTAYLKVLVRTDACADPDRQKYYCVVSNANGSVTTNTVHVNAQHVFGRYVEIDDETHGYYCLGECNFMKKQSKHRFGEWEIVRPATSELTGLTQQKCMDCEAGKVGIIPKVEPGHQHVYNQPRFNAEEHWFACKCGIVSTAPHSPHTWGDPIVIIAATEKKYGKQEVSCTVCGYTKSETLPKLPHTHEWWAVMIRQRVAPATLSTTAIARAATAPSMPSHMYGARGVAAAFPRNR